MTQFDETLVSFYNDYSKITNNLKKIDLFSEASYREYEINLKEAALKVMKENGTDNDYYFYTEEAERDYVTRIKNAIDKIIKTIKDFINECKNKIVKMFGSKNIQDACDKVDEASKINPKVKSGKIEYKDTDKAEKEIDKGIHGINKIITRIKSGKTTEHDSDEIEEIKEKTLKRAAALISVGVITISSAVFIIHKCKSSGGISDNSENDTEVLENAKNGVSNSESAQDAAVLEQCANVAGKLAKERISLKLIKSTSIAAGIRSFISKLKGEVVSEDLTEESVFDNIVENMPMFHANKLILESYKDNENYSYTEESLGNVEGLDLDAYYKTVSDSPFN